MNETNEANPLAMNSVTMSSLEIAKLTGKNHKEVLRYIRKTLKDANLCERNFARTYEVLSPQGGYRNAPCYQLPKRECLLIVAGYDAELRLRLIDRWIELETAALVQKSIPDKITQIKALLGEVVGEKTAAMVLALMPKNKYGSAGDNGKEKIGIRSACFVAANNRVKDAAEIAESCERYYQLTCALDMLNGQLRLPFEIKSLLTDKPE